MVLSNKFAILAGQLNDLSSKLSHGMQELSVQPSNQESTCQTTLSTESIASMTVSILSEEKQKEKCKLNLIIHEPSLLARKKEGIENINKLLNEYVEVSAMIINSIRIGDGPRLNKVTGLSVQEKFFILRNRRNSHDKSYPMHVNKVFITPDLTPYTAKELRTDLVKLNKSGNKGG